MLLHNLDSHRKSRNYGMIPARRTSDSHEEAVGCLLGLQGFLLIALVVCRLQDKVLCFNDDIQVSLPLLTIYRLHFWLIAMRLWNAIMQKMKKHAWLEWCLGWGAQIGNGSPWQVL